MYLGIDIGTSAVKAVIVSPNGLVASEARMPLDVSRPNALWSEQDPADWWEATNQAVNRLDPALRRQVRAIGIAGQMHGAVLLDRNGLPLRPAILWNDGRSFAQCAELERSEPALREISGNIAMPGFTAPKLLWVRENEPDIFDRTAHVLLPKDYVRLRMTGEFATDLSDASGTLWLDVAARAWSDRLLTATGLDRTAMPNVFEGPAATGILRAELAEAWNMSRVPVAAGAGDNAAGAIGVGVTAPGDALLSLGTSGVVFAVTDRFRPNAEGAVHAFCHCLPGVWHQMSVMLSAAACLEWARAFTRFGTVSEMLADLEAAEQPPVDEIFLPYLSGERTPHNNPDALAVFFGLGPDTDPRRMAMAVLEGVAMGLADGVAALAAAGTRLDRINVVGGGARSPLWGRILASAIGIPLVYREGGEVGPSFGAAKLAQICVGDGDIDSVCTAPPVRSVIEPDKRLSEHFQRQQERFRSLYRTVKGQFGRIH